MFILAQVCICGYGSAAENEVFCQESDTQVAAIVNDESILYDGFSEELNDSGKAQYLVSILIRKIAVLEAQKKGIEVTTDEIKKYYDKTYSKNRDNETRKLSNEYLEELNFALEALKQWRTHPEDDNAIFYSLQDKAPRITRQGWQELKDQWAKDDENLRMYEQKVKEIEEDFESPQKKIAKFSPYIKEIILQEKLFKSLPTELAQGFDDNNQFHRFLKGSEIKLDEFKEIPLSEKQEIIRYYNWKNYILNLWPEYDIKITDPNVKKKIYEIIGLNSCTQ